MDDGTKSINLLGPFKCPYCGKEFETYNLLGRHARKHDEYVDNETLVADTFYGGVRPKCKCGCGMETSVCFNGGPHFRDYIKGHQSRVHNNWGHNKKALEHSVETRRERFKSGEIVQWNKGTTWDTTYTSDKIDEMLGILKSKERGDKISKALSGKAKSDEHVAKIRQRMASGGFRISSSGEDRFVKEFIEPLGIEYKRQYLIKEIGQFVDVYIPSRNLFIEYDGDFWHCNPIRYKDGPIYECQEDKVRKDIIKNKWAEENGFKMLRIWEHDANHNKEEVIDRIKLAVIGG